MRSARIQETAAVEAAAVRLVPAAALRGARALAAAAQRALAGGAPVLVAVALALAAPATALAQQAGLQVAQGPHYAGVPIDLQVVVEGFEEEPQPEVSTQAPAGATVEFVQARPQVSSMMQIINGKVTQSREVRFGFVFRMTASKPGRYTLGPFTVTQGAQRVETRAVSLDVVEIPAARGQRLRVLLPTGDVFLGQRVPVTVEWWTETGLADRLFNQRLNLPLFLDAANFQFLDEAKQESRVAISVDTPGGPVDFAAEVKQVVEGGKQWVVRTFTRTLVPVGPGRFDLGRPTLYCDEAVAWRRDFFGSRVPAQVRKQRVTGDPLVLEVKPVPAVGRPASFAGAIGQGFTLDVAADRTVVQTGDPVRLTFTLRGDGSFDAASLPRLDAAGLSPKQFRLPDGEVAGVVGEGAKTFEVTVRVLDPALREIPPVEYSWFDPSTGRFEKTASQPIALSVRAATVVGAGDVVSAAPAATAGEEGRGEAGGAASKEPTRTAAASAKPAFSLTGADLAVETDPAKLRASSSSVLGSTPLLLASYAGGALLLAGAFALRRRRGIDPVKARTASERRTLLDTVSRGSSAREVADALRRLVALHEGPRVEEADAVLAGLDEAVYAPGGASAAPPAALKERAVAAARALAEERR